MLTTDVLCSDPSCSSKASDQAAAVHEASGFTIRDYVFKSRSKDIGINWPFSEQSLQFCSDNGIRDVLPPFETLSLMRACCSRRRVNSDKVPRCSKNKQITQSREDGIELAVSSDQSKLSLREKRREFKDCEEDNPDNRLIGSESDINATLTTSHNLVKGISDKQSCKNCRLAVELCSYSGSGRRENLVSGLTIAADPMASKVCPVCKSFISTSNTTLNAHIDQCLSYKQSNAAMNVTGCPKAEVKPRKKRLMVDIYTTAPHCTLEELDKRNGTTWATDLSLVAPVSDAKLETDKKLSTAADTVNQGDVGDIYVDSHGTKLLILSKYNDSPPFASRKGFKLKKNGKESRTNYLIAKKKSLKVKCPRFMKDGALKKKLKVTTGLRQELVAANEVDNAMEAHQQKEPFLSIPSRAHDQLKKKDHITLGHWICSKRSDLSRKFNGKGIRRGSEKIVTTDRKLSGRLTQSSSSNLSSESFPNFSKSSEAADKVMDSVKEGSRQPSNPTVKLLPSDALVDGHTVRISSSNKGSYPSLVVRKSFTSKRSILSKRMPSLEANNIIETEGVTTPRNFQIHRPSSGSSKLLEERRLNVNGICNGSSEDCGLISTGEANKANKEHQPNFCEIQKKGSLDPMRSISTVFAADKKFQSTEEHAESIPGNESRLESASQRSQHDQEAPICADAISNDIIIHDSQLAGEIGLRAELVAHSGDFQAGAASIQNPHPCFSKHREPGLDDNHVHSSTTSLRVKSSEECRMGVESSGVQVSTYASTICATSLHDCKRKDTDKHQRARLTHSVQDKLSPITVRKDNKVKSSPTAREPACSCSQSLSRESQLQNHTGKKMASSLFIKTPAFSSFQPGSGLESPTESVITMASSKSCANTSCPCSCARTQAASNPVLRLMGKDLVVNKEEGMKVPEILPCDVDYNSRTKLISFGLPIYSSFGYNSYYHYPIPSVPGYQPSLHAHQRRSQYTVDSSYLAREAIAINNESPKLAGEQDRKFSSLPRAIPNPHLAASQRFFSCFPGKNPYAQRAVNLRQHAIPEGSFMFHSPSSLYYSSTQR